MKYDKYKSLTPDLLSEKIVTAYKKGVRLKTIIDDVHFWQGLTKTEAKKVVDRMLCENVMKEKKTKGRDVD